MITSISDAKKIRPPPCTGLLVLLAARVVADVIVLSYVVVAGALAPACFLYVDSTAHRPQRHRPNEGKRDRMLTRIGGPRSRAREAPHCCGGAPLGLPRGTVDGWGQITEVEWAGVGGQLISPAASRTAASISLGFTSSSLATCFSAFSAALSTACSILLSPTTTSAAAPSSMTSPNSLTSARDMPRHKCPPIPPTAAPTAAVPMIEGGNKIPSTAPTAAPPQAPCRVAISSLLTCTLPS